MSNVNTRYAEIRLMISDNILTCVSLHALFPISNSVLRI